jgi:hypothetical protein
MFASRIEIVHVVAKLSPTDEGAFLILNKGRRELRGIEPTKN